MTDSDDSYYAQLPIHRSMLRDRARCEAYRQALIKSVLPGSVVLDMGAGTGVLSLLAIQAGARKVYAVERTGIVNLARQLIAANNAQRQVRIIHGDMETIELPEQVDLIVSEWLGGYGVDEGFLPALLLARNRWLKPDGKMLPERVTAWMSPVYDCELERDMNFWRSQPYGIDLSLIAEATANELFWERHHITAETLLAVPREMWLTDAYTCSIEEARLPFKAMLSFIFAREGNFNALATWFSADFGQGICLTNAPDAPQTHWGRFVFPLKDKIKVERGTEALIEFSCEPTIDSHCRNHWSVKVGDGAWEHHQSAV